MFRKATGLKGQYGSFTILLAADFDEWRILLHRPGLVINGGRQFNESKAKDQAITIADAYFAEYEPENQPPPGDAAWTPLGKGEWLNWRP